MNDNKDERWSVRLKIWLEIDGLPLMGEGRMAMLNAIDENGSIIEAARSLGIPYRKIRGAISAMEKSVGKALVKTHRGGGHGGGAHLTAKAHELVKEYLEVTRSFHQEASVPLQSMGVKNLPPNGRICHSVKMGEQ
ncbi:molybdate transport system regulatory protein [Desulfocicer vacuolatum DSM 3385]|uniref:Molybdate transport system regulatory protein n=1 Tax=Desulfocicer vacuolatum DSM 3385 TaxID=1121400 RepID=A0A1W1ZWE9_9BACT|nr:LysR family transcriptional regulator [Desulfocicer vacuolatum]SMC52734.1 molybdate transport system regulatory protein [Desulfocicer vacuolatum DSM 3385]